jgi:hypothetical protein
MRLIVLSVRKLLPTLLDDEDASFENDSDSGYQGSCDGYLIGADGNGFPTLVYNCWTGNIKKAPLKFFKKAPPPKLPGTITIIRKYN